MKSLWDDTRSLVAETQKIMAERQQIDEAAKVATLRDMTNAVKKHISKDIGNLMFGKEPKTLTAQMKTPAGMEMWFENIWFKIYYEQQSNGSMIMWRPYIAYQHPGGGRNGTENSIAAIVIKDGKSQLFADQGAALTFAMK